MTPTVPHGCQHATSGCAIDRSKSPLCGTGMEYQAAHDSGAAVIAQHDGKVTYADADKVEVRRKMDLLMSITSKNSVVQTQVLLTTNVPL